MTNEEEVRNILYTNFTRAISEINKITDHWKTGGTFVECPGCGGLCREETGDNS